MANDYQSKELATPLSAVGIYKFSHHNVLQIKGD
jgi:hypothetical protein